MRPHTLLDPTRDSLYRDRIDAGRKLADALERYKGQRPLVVGIPRGGVPVAAEVARCLGGELDIVVARKLGAPMHQELAIGAVTADGGRFLNQDVIRALQVSSDYLERITAEEVQEARSREARFRGGRTAGDLKGRTVILVDDGLATGATMRAAIRSLRSRNPTRLVIAVPVGARETCASLAKEADEIVCPVQPEPFIAIGLHYDNFDQVDDAEVLALLQRN
jgi:predicted phosphoribosyltransferase